MAPASGRPHENGRKARRRKERGERDGGRPQTPRAPSGHRVAAWSAAGDSPVQAPGRRLRPWEPTQAQAPTFSSTRFRRAPIELLPRSFVFSVG